MACVVNLGCRVNRVESDSIVRALAAEGFRVADDPAASVVVINTCAVTGEAEAKTRKAVRRALSRPAKPWVIVCGCAVNLDPDRWAALGGRVIVETRKAEVPKRALGVLGLEGPVDDGSGTAPALPELVGRSRLGVKIQDGCNNRCSYCIVWKARGRERSVDALQVLEQVRRADAEGVPEVVLTGVNLAAWRGAGAAGRTLVLEDLLSLLLEQSSIPQIRLSSLEPMDVRPGLLELVASSGGRVAPYLHLPLQAGCTDTLRRMRRPYTAEDYERIAGLCRAIVPGIALSCDVIAGFPGESDGEFEETFELCRRVGFAKMHVFRYSARPGTPAAEAPDQVDPRTMADRAARLRELGALMTRDDAAARVGTVERAVIEDGARGTLGSFHRVFIDGLSPSDRQGPSSPRLVEVAIMGMDGDGLLHGRLVPPDGALACDKR